MKASDIMVDQVVKVLEADTIKCVLEKFVSRGIGGMPVVNHCNQIKGYISDGDIMRAVSSHNNVVVVSPFFTSTWTDTQTMEEKCRDIADANVMDYARAKVITVNVDTPLNDVAALLGRKHLQKIVVEKNGGYLAGIISRGDMVRFFSRQYLSRLHG